MDVSVRAVLHVSDARADQEGSEVGSLIARAKAALGISNADNENRLWVEGLLTHLDVPIPAHITLPDDHPLAGRSLKLLIDGEDAQANLDTLILQPIDMRWDATGHEREKQGLTNGIRGTAVLPEIRNGNELWVAFCFWQKDFPDEARFFLENIGRMGMSIDMGAKEVVLSTAFPDTALFRGPRFYGGTLLFRNLAADKESRIGALGTALPFHDLPLSDRDRAWDAGAARDRIRAWSHSEDSPSDRYKEAFLWVDGDRESEFTAYKFPIADVIDGSLQAVPKAIFAAAADLGKSDIPPSDQSKLKSIIEHWYARMSESFKEPDLVAPWNRGDASAEQSAGSPPEEIIMDLDKILAVIQASSKEVADSLREVLKAKDGEIATLREQIATASSTLSESQKAEIERALREAFEADKAAAVAAVTETAAAEAVKVKELSEQVESLRALCAETKTALESATAERDALKAASDEREKNDALAKVLAERLGELNSIHPLAESDVTSEFKTALAQASEDKYEVFKMKQELAKVKAGGASGTREDEGTQSEASAHASFKGTSKVEGMGEVIDLFAKHLGA